MSTDFLSRNSGPGPGHDARLRKPGGLRPLGSRETRHLVEIALRSRCLDRHIVELVSRELEADRDSPVGESVSLSNKGGPEIVAIQLVHDDAIGIEVVGPLGKVISIASAALALPTLRFCVIEGFL